jgi:nitroimidazol reductase NimA-like FMN-containing flavoprotein (pyridoxamine 5'-phosphate oxidase superfamily)
MLRKSEEPILIDVQKNSLKAENIRYLENDIRKLLESQAFGVLATQGKGITVTSLITFASSNDLRYIVFATPRQTGKFDLITNDENISILVDDRSLHQDSINKISALTITGRARILSDEKEIIEWGNQLTKKHPNLITFVKAKTSAVILVEVVSYQYVKRFQEVWEWDPSNHYTD